MVNQVMTASVIRGCYLVINCITYVLVCHVKLSQSTDRGQHGKNFHIRCSLDSNSDQKIIFLLKCDQNC